MFRSLLQCTNDLRATVRAATADVAQPRQTADCRPARARGRVRAQCRAGTGRLPAAAMRCNSVARPSAAGAKWPCPLKCSGGPLHAPAAFPGTRSACDLPGCGGRWPWSTGC